jgi:hypothetical protein
MTRAASWFLVAVLFGVFLATAGYAIRARAAAGKGMPEFSVYSEERNGLSEAARLVRRLGWEPVAVTRPIQNTHRRGLLILAEPELTALLPGESPDLPEADIQGLLRWVEQGNTLLLCSGRNSALHRALDVVVLRDDTSEDETPRRVEPIEAGRYTDGVRKVEVADRYALYPGVGLALWSVGDRPGAVLVRRGTGRVLVIADPSFLTTRRLHKKADNLVFLYNVAAQHARDGVVYFDEYHHGLQAGGGFWGYLQYHGQRAALLPVLLVIGVAIWAMAVRLGPAVARPPQTKADAVDYASAVARIYQRAGTRHILASGLARSFLAALTAHLHLRRSALPAEVLAAWRQQYPKESADRLQALLRGIGELRRGDVSERDLMAWTRAFDQFRDEFLRQSKRSRAGAKRHAALR